MLTAPTLTKTPKITQTQHTHLTTLELKQSFQFSTQQNILTHTLHFQENLSQATLLSIITYSIIFCLSNN